MNAAWRHGRPPWVLAGIAAGAAAFSLLLGITGVGRSAPEWQVRLDEDVPRYSSANTSIVGPAAHLAQERIFNDLLRRWNWTDSEARELCGLLRAGYPVPLAARRAMSAEDFGRAMVHSAASVALLARLEVGAPMTPSARGLIVGAFIDELGEAFPERRCNAAMALIVSKSIEEPAVRAMVEQLTEDADPETAEIVAMQLAHYDDQKSRALALADRE